MGSASREANLGFAKELCEAVDVLRNSMDAAEYKHVVLGLICLEYISDTFDEQHTKLDRLMWANLEDIGYGEA